jgi:hypothetical protein
MSRQLLAKEVLLIADSNVSRNLLHSGRLYQEQSDFRTARNLNEFAEAIRDIPQGSYKMVVFAMLTNIVIDAGNSAATSNFDTRLGVIQNCLRDLITEIRFALSTVTSYL